MVQFSKDKRFAATGGIRERMMANVQRLLGIHLLAFAAVGLLALFTFTWFQTEERAEQVHSQVVLRVSDTLTSHLLLIQNAIESGDFRGTQNWPIAQGTLARVDDKAGATIFANPAIGSLAIPQALLTRSAKASVIRALIVTVDDQRNLLIAYPINQPFKAYDGGMLISILPLDYLIDGLRLPVGSDIDVSMTGSDVHVQTPVGSLRLAVVVNVSPWRYAAIFGSLLLIVALPSVWLAKTLREWTVAFAQDLRERIGRFQAAVADLAAGRNNIALKDTTGDELAAVMDATQSLALTMQAGHEELLTASRAIDTAADAILITDSFGRIERVNGALERLLGYSSDDLLGKSAGVLYKTNDLPSELSESIVSALGAEGRWRGESYLVTRDNRMVPVLASVSSLRSNDSRHLGNVAIFTDVTPLKDAEQRLNDLSFTDALTGLPNFRAFLQFIEKKIPARSEVSLLPVSHHFVLLFIDLDHLKRINDAYGHEQGDLVIRQMTVFLKEALPQGSFLCRRSGDEFIAVIEVARDVVMTRQAVEASFALASEKFANAEHLVSHASFSAGAVVFPEHAENIHDLLSMAGAALISAKADNTGGLTWMNADLLAATERRIRLEIKLKQAVIDQKIIAHYQPEIDMRTGELTGFEALARWHDDEFGDVSPGEFIPLAENMFLADDVTELMISQVLTDLPKLRSIYPDVRVAFNVSPRLLVDNRAIDLIRRQVAAGSLPRGLVMEITETDLIESFSEAHTQLQEAIDLGLEIAIDDFGKGYSSLSRLGEFPIHKLKIDSSFVFNLSEPVNQKIVGTMIALGRLMGLKVSAEGVEAVEQQRLLVALGCHYAQGFLYSKAISLAEAMVLPRRFKID